MAAKIAHLKTYINELSDILTAIGFLSWDRRVNMPRGGTEGRAYLLATLARIAHQKGTAPEAGQLLEDAAHEASRLDPDSDDARLVKLSRRAYLKRTKIPAQWVEENARVVSTAQSVWEEAKSRSDFALFRPHLEKIVALKRQYSSFFTPFDHIYDPFLDDFEPGMKTREVTAIFDVVRPEQVALIKSISQRPQVNDSFLHLPFDEKAQWEFGVEVVTRLGFDWNRGRQDVSIHPFTQALGYGDVRFTTRFDPEYPLSELFSTMHECGHALYDQGVSKNLQRSPLSSEISMSLHESQSRMWENLVGRSLPFWKFFYSRLQAKFPSQLGNVDLTSFYQGINKVEPTLIRVEADEATYNLHIMLRMEMEIALLEGSLEVKDLPAAWNERMRDYLGITPPNAARGVLQDVHWSSGNFGYFPTYALGNLVSVQLWEAMLKDIPDLSDQITQGNFRNMLGWLREGIHQHGAKFEPQEMIEKATGSRMDPQPYLRYLKRKYSEIYQL
jgi:carboxypeptidase Taq